MVPEQGWLLYQSTPDGSFDGYAVVRPGPLIRCGRGPEEECLCTSGAECGLILSRLIERFGQLAGFFFEIMDGNFQGKVLMILIHICIL